MKVVWVRVREDGKTDELPLKAGLTVIGRDTGCDVQIPAAAVSRRHCQVTIDDESVAVRDLGSSNGTYLNHHKVEGEQQLVAGDVVGVGPFMFLTQIDGEPVEIDAASVTRATAKPGEEEQPAPPTGTATSSLTEGLELDDEPGRGDAERPAAADPEGSSEFDFDFDLGDDEDEDEQPPL